MSTGTTSVQTLAEKTKLSEKLIQQIITKIGDDQTAVVAVAQLMSKGASLDEAVHQYHQVKSGQSSYDPQLESSYDLIQRARAAATRDSEEYGKYYQHFLRLAMECQEQSGIAAICEETLPSRLERYNQVMAFLDEPTSLRLLGATTRVPRDNWLLASVNN